VKQAASNALGKQAEKFRTCWFWSRKLENVIYSMQGKVRIQDPFPAEDQNLRESEIRSTNVLGKLSHHD
jgi:hypothetical protein